MKTPLTPNEKRVLALVQHSLAAHDRAPSFTELQSAMGWSSINMVTKTVARLKEKKLITTGMTQAKRSIRLVNATEKGLLAIPLLGMIRAGALTDTYEDTTGELIEAPEWMVPPNADCGFLEVRGDSMKDLGIHDGDYVLIKRQATAEHNQTVAVSVGPHKTLKKLIMHLDRIELRPCNPEYESIFLEPGEDLNLIGVCISLIRRKI